MKCLKPRKIGGKKAPSHEGGGDQMSTSVCVKADRHSRLNLNFSFFLLLDFQLKSSVHTVLYIRTQHTVTDRVKEVCFWNILLPDFNASKCNQYCGDGCGISCGLR